MSARRAAAAFVVLGALALAAFVRVSGDTPVPARRTVYSKQLPPGEGQDLVASKCLTCHSAMLITQQHKDSTGWEKSVKLMETWGAPVPPDQHGELIRYLIMSLGPAKK